MGSEMCIRDRLILMSTYNGGETRSVATFADGQWRRLASPMAVGFNVPANDQAFVLATRLESGPQPVQYFDANTDLWTDAPFETLARASRGLVALSATPDNPGNGVLQGARIVDGTWQRVADAPFSNRMEPAVEAIGDLVIVIGGEQGLDLQPQNDTWILDLSAPPVSES